MQAAVAEASRARAAGLPATGWRRRRGLSSSITAFFICLGVTAVLLAVSPAFWHWFVIPVFLCGVVIVADAVDWVLGRVDLMDPVGIIGAIGTLHFFAAPFLHVYWDQWLADVTYPPDWRPWLGWMALLNFVGLVGYRIARGRTAAAAERRPKKVWQLDRGRFRVAMLVATPVALSFAGLLYVRFGGISGYMGAYVEGRLTSFEGLGWMFMFADSIPILVLLAYAVFATRSPAARSWIAVFAVLATVFVLRLGFGGLRGSRSSLVWALIWAVGVVHLWVRPVPRKVVSVGMVFLFLVIYVMAFYKGVGGEAFRDVTGARERAVLERETRYSTQAVVLFDMARSSVQAYLLYRLTGPDTDYEYALGRTYVGGLAVAVPRALWPDRPITKVQEGTNALYGRDSFSAGRVQAYFVYGLAGEAMLNFGPVAAPLALIALGLAVRFVRGRFSFLDPGDVRRLLFPFLSTLCLVIVLSDSDNVVSYVVQNGTVPFLVLFASARRVPRDALPAGG
ncbi:MAG TPA: hypothetical protein VHN37_11565 [Actinomycetota bacterium]|nr:hypothetical protein [Actinomycetota bacterium]